MQAVPISLATTLGISVDFFSSSYLDVSVHSVRLHWPMYSARDTLAGGFPHSDIFGSMLVCELPEAFRTLQRPSSPVIAKASTTCTYSLDPITLMPLTRPASFEAVTGIEFRVLCRIPSVVFVKRTLKTWLIQSHPCFDLDCAIQHASFHRSTLLYFFRIVKDRTAN